MSSTNAQLESRAKQVLFQNYRTAPIALVRGAGSRVWDADGKVYLDCIGGIAVCGLGHAHPRVLAALEAQARKLWHASNLFYTEPQIELAERLVPTFAGGDARAFFCNSGAEANEALLKLARRFHSDAGHPERVEIVCALDSFHGRTYGALAATGQPKYQHGFEPLPAGFVHVPYGDAEALAAAVGPRTAAILLEPIQGEAGVRVPPRGYLGDARALADKAGALLMLDEVQTGVGRTGKLWAHHHEGIIPDALSFAKGIANGMALGGILATSKLAATFVPGTHASTFGGNPLATAAAVAVFDELQSGAMERGRVGGERLVSRLASMIGRVEGVKQVRGAGMLLGVELKTAAAPVVARARDLGLLVNAAGDNVVRLAPSLLLSDAEIDEAASLLERAIAEAR